MRYVIAISCLVIISLATWLLVTIKHKHPVTAAGDTATSINPSPHGDTADYGAAAGALNGTSINTGNTNPAALVQYAETLIGVPYVYASSNPSVGFDCSGFITYVFNHFNITVPRASVNFTNAAPEVALNDAKPADLILFTGTDSATATVGHMGIVVQHDANGFLFIHSTSGKANGVTITPLNAYYKSRFVKIVRVFPQNNHL